jgi:hypothetical protein
MNTFALIITLCGIVSAAWMLPASEYNALKDLYSFTNGDNWKWSSPYTDHGYPWNFTINQNPCNSSYPWQGVLCSSDCSFAPCNVLNLTLSSHELKGNKYFIAITKQFVLTRQYSTKYRKLNLYGGFGLIAE